MVAAAHPHDEPSLPKQMTNLLVGLERSDGRGQSQNPMRYETFVISARDSSH